MVLPDWAGSLVRSKSFMVDEDHVWSEEKLALPTTRLFKYVAWGDRTSTKKDFVDLLPVQLGRNAGSTKTGSAASRNGPLVSRREHCNSVWLPTPRSVSLGRLSRTAILNPSHYLKLLSVSPLAILSQRSASRPCASTSPPGAAEEPTSRRTLCQPASWILLATDKSSGTLIHSYLV